MQLDMAKFRRALLTVLFHTLVVNLLVAVPHYRLQQHFRVSFKPDQIPSGWIIVRDLSCCVLVGEAVFYYSHRLAETEIGEGPEKHCVEIGQIVETVESQNHFM